MLGKDVVFSPIMLTHLPLVSRISQQNWNRIGSDNGLSLIRRQAII